MSDGLVLNFGGTKPASGFSIIKTGTYDMRVEKIEVKNTNPKDGVEQKTSDGKPAQYLNVTYKVIEEGSENGKNCWGIHSIRFPENPLDDTEKEHQTREIFLGWLNTVTGTEWQDTEQALNLNNLIGSKVRVTVEEDSYQGRPKNNVKRVAEIGSGGAAGLDAIRRTL